MEDSSQDNEQQYNNKIVLILQDDKSSLSEFVTGFMTHLTVSSWVSPLRRALLDLEPDVRSESSSSPHPPTLRAGLSPCSRQM